jgi:hypothetical protein
MPKKDKLSKEERSQIAKDRWAKIKASKAQDKPNPVKEWVGEAVSDGLLSATSDTPAPSGRDENGVPSIVGLGDGKVLPNGAFVPDQSDIVLSTSGVYRQNPDGSFTEIGKGIDAGQRLSPSAPIAPAPAPQLTPVAPKKQKRYTGPKEFSGALKAAEKRLAKARNERAEALGKYESLQKEIPYLLGIIKSLKGEQLFPIPQSFVTPQAFQPPAPLQAPLDPMDAIRAAMAAPPVSRASGGAVQFSPDVVGSLEGPDDDNPDKFITGEHAGGGWIGA